tara:strand:- start:334 stop:627 length:294 start_codon:yes stop_codon:yes gene_type:complete
MARVFTPEGDDYILGLTGNMLHDAGTLFRLLGGEFESVELGREHCMLYSKSLKDWPKEAQMNEKATSHLSQYYNMVMPVPGVAILITLDDFLFESAS